jgi:hypothetical protein
MDGARAIGDYERISLIPTHNRKGAVQVVQPLIIGTVSGMILDVLYQAPQDRVTDAAPMKIAAGAASPRRGGTDDSRIAGRQLGLRVAGLAIRRECRNKGSASAVNSIWLKLGEAMESF